MRLHSIIASAPRLAECNRFRAGFPSRYARESASGVRSVPNWADALFLASLCLPRHDSFSKRHLEGSPDQRRPEVSVLLSRDGMCCDLPHRR